MNSILRSSSLSSNPRRRGAPRPIPYFARARNYMAPSRYPKRYVRRGGKCAIVRGVGLPQCMYINLKYSSYGSLTDTTTVVASNSFGLMSMNDIEGGGEQPRYYNQLLSGTLYTKFKVMKASYKVTFLNVDATVNNVAVMVRSDDFTPPTTATLLQNSLEFPDTKGGLLNPAATAGNKKIFKGSIKPRDILGQTKTQYISSPNNTGKYDTSPTNQVNLHVLGACIPTDSSGVDVDYLIEIVYRVKLSDLAGDIGVS